MTIYERVVDGQVVERVDPVPGGYEDTRLGLSVLEGHGGWRIAGAAPPPADQPAPVAAESAAAEPAADPAPGVQEPPPPAGRRRKS